MTLGWPLDGLPAAADDDPRRALIERRLLAVISATTGQATANEDRLHRGIATALRICLDDAQASPDNPGATNKLVLAQLADALTVLGRRSLADLTDAISSLYCGGDRQAAEAFLDDVVSHGVARATRPDLTLTEQITRATRLAIAFIDVG